MRTEATGITHDHTAHRLRWLAVSLACALASACASPPPPAPPPAAVDSAPVAVPAAEPIHAPPAPEKIEPAPKPRPLRFFTLEEVLVYMTELRSMTPAGLTAELAALGEPGDDVDRQLRVALTLINTRRAADTARALALLQKTDASADTAIEPLKPLVRVLMARLLEQRRLEEQAERQTQIAREYQRKIEALNSRLEAMRAIERSLSPNPMSPGAPPRAPGS
ncbi:hypothetical protein [Hydrogenophaga sp. 5NK40-0174]|uniref:hypothetical protein n=1 Tax=Hydrogenophaga sp. 5NK40-0174 TaxID=3127649 RepID=UPI0031057270